VESLGELRALCTKFELHSQNFKDWLKMGGPINPMWVRETADLRRELHRAQCRAAQRIFNADQESNSRCLGAFLVYRRQREVEAHKRESGEQALLPQWRQQQQPGDRERRESEGGNGDAAIEDPARLSMEDLIPDCNAVGTFERLGDRDIAFVCDFCDGHMVWDGVQMIPPTRAVPTSHIAAGYPNWKASARAIPSGEDKTIVFPPLAVANHLPPWNGGWEARIWCPYCDDYTYYDQNEDDQTKYAQEEGGSPDLPSFQEHLEWHHTALPVPSLSNNCAVM